MDPHTIALLTTLVAFLKVQLPLNGIAAWLIQVLKTNQGKWSSWITVNTPWISRLLATITAALTGVGINATFTGNWHAGSFTWAGVTGVGLLTATGHVIWTVAQNYLMQHAWYKTAFKS